MLKIPRLMLCGVSSGSGKTWITAGILQALKKRGIQIEAFKCGPDYIDPMFHEKILGIPCRNLDPYFTKEHVLRFLFQRGSGNRDLAVIEGVMGYYDGIGGISEKGSSYELASVLETPAVLVLPCKGLSASSAAIAKGYLHYRTPSHIKGVLLNQAPESLYPGLKKLIEDETGIPVVGYVPVRKDLAVESRHLGLVLPDECRGFQNKFEELAKMLEKTLDFEKILQIAASAPDMEEAEDPLKGHVEQRRQIRVGVAKDEAFCFLYEDNLEFLREIGVKPVFFSPLRDRGLPDGISGLILPGGYPELHAARLSENRSMLREIREAAGKIPILAECGGFLYLHEILEDAAGAKFHLAGVISGTAYPAGKLARFGYIELEAHSDQLLLKKGQKIKAHEFHYWESSNSGNDCTAKKASGNRSWDCVHGKPALYAGFPHIYFYANPAAGLRFADICAKTKK